MRASVLPILIALSACGGEGTPPPESPANAYQTSLEVGPDRWGTFHSKRFALTVRLPGGSEWRIDDRSAPELVATHAPTGSRLIAQRWNDLELQTHATCEARLRDRRLLPPAAAVVVEDDAAFRPNGDDVRIWVAIEPGAAPESPIRGHATLVGANLKKCWFVHYATEVASAKQETELSARLALVREGTLQRVVVDDTRVIVSGKTPRR